jgi:hypothetical protein
MKPPEKITCIDCLGTASLISFLPDDEEIEPGTALAYRCADCLERFDVVIEDDEEDEEAP